MPNSNPQAVAVANGRIRPLADRFAQLYSELKAAQIAYTAEGWAALFPNDAEIMVDGSATDGRTPIANSDIRNFMLTDVVTFLNALEANANATRDRVHKIGVNY